MIGEAIESLLDDLYDHRFTNSAVADLSYSDVEEILRSTVSIKIFNIDFKPDLIYII